MGLNLEYEVLRNDFTKAGEASSNIKKILTQLGINSSIIRRIAIATYEAEMNIAIHSLGGCITVNVTPKEINIVALDNGPGIEDIELAMQEGYSTAPNSVRELGFGAGMGLSNMKRCSDEFKITSQKGKNTRVNMIIYI
ncbi:MAG: anti-sigma regulatory factor [Firmicutes bacterium]|nr:anti-sigma regulatory factor [Bacillota bacterium]